jgi:uncharacterized protein (TIGR02246 family)
MGIRVTYLTSLFVAVALVSACNYEDRKAEEKVAEAPDAGAPAARAVDREAEAQQIREIDRKILEAIAAKDAATVASHYAEDAILLPQAEKKVEGRDAIRAWYENILQVPNLDFRFEPTNVQVSQAGDMAYDLGTVAVSGDGPDGSRFEEAGKYIVVWKKVGEVWKIAVDAGNSDTPRPAPSE